MTRTRTIGGRSVDRRTALAAIGAGAAGLALPSRAEANPAVARFAWAVMQFIGEQVISWGIGRLLDAWWDSDEKEDLIAPYITPKPNLTAVITPLAERFAVDVFFKQNEAWARPSAVTSAFAVSKHLCKGLEQETISPARMLEKWGAPTALARWIELSDGMVGWQWYRQFDKRLVVMRTFGTSAIFLPCKNDYADTAFNTLDDFDKTKKKPNKIKAGSQLTTLISDPASYALDPKDKP